MTYIHGRKILKENAFSSLDQGRYGKLCWNSTVQERRTICIHAGILYSDAMWEPFKYFSSGFNIFRLNKTNKGTVFIAPNIIIAGGVGSFEPRKLPLKELSKFEGKSVFYSVTNKNLFKNKKISIFGGGDSALDWALEFSKYSKVTLIHRRNEFRGAPHTLKELEKLKAEGKITIKTPFLIDSINEDSKEENNEKTEEKELN